MDADMTATTGIRYAHTNLIANDWRRLQDFYVQVFGCEPVSTERDNKGPAFEALTGIIGGSIRGRHVRLPGHGERGPTLEIFQYHQNDPSLPTSLTRPGFAHLAFEVPDVEGKRQEILRWGGREVGQLVTIDIPGAGRLTLIYMTDPEGNIIELQRWH
jgi:catechol 2,3-dioxygenase-like lactoylglutathione lyase family enzyme